MNSIVQKGLEAITARTNLDSGLSHPNDKNAAKEMFVLLHRAGEILFADEIELWAILHGWEPRDAAELASLGERIGCGMKPRIKGGPWWRPDIIEWFRTRAVC